MTAKTVINLSMILLLGLFFLNIYGCKGMELEGIKVSPSIAIDGNRSDWDSVPIIYDDENNTAFGVCHDDDNLYILFSFNEPMWARLIQAKGVKIWLNSNGKKERNFGLTYTGAPKQRELSKLGGRAMPDMARDRMKDRMPDSLMRDQGNDSIIQITRVDNFDLDVPADGSRGYAVKYGIYNNICAYEFRIPIRDNPDFTNGLAYSDISKIKIGLEWGGMEMKRDGAKGGGPGGGGGGGMPGGGGGMGGGPPGGGGPGGGAPDGADSMQKFTEEQEIWFTYKLNENKS